MTAAVLAGGTVTACSSDSSDKPRNPVAAPTPKVGDIPSCDPEKGARPDAVPGDCGRDDKGEWKFAGTVNNRSKDKRDYSIVVDFVLDEGNTVVDTKVVKVPGVAGGKSADWTILGASGKEDDLRCVIRNVQFS
ncbi:MULTISPECIES: hypothetical protein [Pseudofrankia]|uniref:hypothetical protein n=1 Tax=Pseudofrankia TaxID=2994363 RepID=UPI0002FEF5F3|nr:MULTISPECIES: hypothetical protein [Pseudofrankia]